MRVLIVKLSSLGDVVHTLPALTDAKRALPDIEFDWVIEEAFADIPTWHPAVKAVIPIALRRFRKQPLSVWREGVMQRAITNLRYQSYDLIIDAQGLLKSAWVARMAKGVRAGFSRECARERWAAACYDKTFLIKKSQHAITRVRQLFAEALMYKMPSAELDYGLRLARPANLDVDAPITLLHGSAWPTKQWPETYWKLLITRLIKEGYRVRIFALGKEEVARTERLAQGLSGVECFANRSLHEIALSLLSSRAVVSVDSGLGHLAAALTVPVVGIYGPTDIKLTGMQGVCVDNLEADFSCAPCLQRVCSYQGPAYYADEGVLLQPSCFSQVTPDQVITALQSLIARSENSRHV